MMSRRFVFTMILFVAVIAGGMLAKQAVTGQEEDEWQPAEVDYEQLSAAVEQVLEEMPEIQSELESIRSGSEKKRDELFNQTKTEFRLRVENHLTEREHSTEFLKAMAEKERSRYIDALQTAKEKYAISVSEEEVTKYIDENVAVVRNAEKKKYAEALGLTLKELDYEFDRDFYVMDVLWTKLMPILMEEMPKKEGETETAYWERVKEEFYLSGE